jgi:hypothetical protein
MKQQQGAQLGAEPVLSPDDAGQDEAGRSRGGAAPRMKPQVQEHIGRQLRAVYDDVLKQPLPDRFRELMEKLDQKMGDGE